MTTRVTINKKYKYIKFIYLFFFKKSKRVAYEPSLEGTDN
jgi:hypothetical protein